MDADDIRPPIEDASSKVVILHWQPMAPGWYHLRAISNACMS